MLFASRLWTALGLLLRVVGAKDSSASDIHYNTPSSSTHTLEQTILSHTIGSTTPLHVPSTEAITPSIPTESKPTYPTISSSTSTTIITSTPTESKPVYPTTLLSTSTTILYVPTTITTSIIIKTTSSNTSTTTTTVPTTITTSITIETTSSTISTTTTTVPTTITPAPTPSNPCPTYCSISAGTVNLFFWPTNEPYTYPSTYVDTALDYTFTSPSVYMVVNTIFGYNSAGRAGPSGTSVVFALDLDQVSTLVPGVSATQQLTLNDLGTDCPQSEAASVIATAAPDGRCDPILVAPDSVKSWALPCNACGRFGLFDPPYAVPPLAGGLVVTTATATPQPQTPSTTPAATVVTSTPVAPTPTPLSITSSVNTFDPNSTVSMVTTASASRVTGGLAGLIFSLFVSVYLL